MKVAFNKKNYIIIGVGVLITIIGFILMSGGGSEDITKFNPDIFSFRRITLAPMLCIVGYGVVLYGIMKRPESANENLPSEKTKSKDGDKW